MEQHIIIAALIVSITVIFIFNQYNKSKERRIMLEKGLDPSLMNIYPGKGKSMFFLYAGILLLGLALGMISGFLLAALWRTPDEKEIMILTVIIFTGFSSILCYYISGKANE